MFKITTFLAGLLVLVCPTQGGSASSCTLKCGTVVDDGWKGKDEGSNDCNSCFCHDGVLGCTLMACETKSCPTPAPVPAPTGESCTLRCGTVVADGYRGYGEGSNNCNRCSCVNGALLCTKMGCATKSCPDVPKKTCTLRCGTVVPHGWNGKGEGSNDCNSCFCHDGVLGCTLMACETKACPTPAPVPAPTGESCTLRCGTVVADGYRGYGEGSNDCNRCSCVNGALLCTKMDCATKSCPDVPKKTCTLRCGTVVPHGWNGKGEGSNDCNSCFCHDGVLGCTKMGCMTQSCPDVAKKTCTLQCGTVVADGWTGKGEKSDHCNDCRCASGSLACTLRACTPGGCYL